MAFLMQRTDFPIEVLIHDDASTDGTEEFYKKTKDPEIYDLWYIHVKPMLQNHLYKNKFEKLSLIWKYYSKDTDIQKVGQARKVKKIIQAIKDDFPDCTGTFYLDTG